MQNEDQAALATDRADIAQDSGMRMRPWEWAWPVRAVQLTGRVRTRLQTWTKKIILQVEEAHHRGHFMTGETGPPPDLRWRDATYADMELIELQGGRRA